MRYTLPIALLLGTLIALPAPAQGGKVISFSGSKDAPIKVTDESGNVEVIEEKDQKTVSYSPKWKLDKPEPAQYPKNTPKKSTTTYAQKTAKTSSEQEANINAMLKQRSTLFHKNAQATPPKKR